MTQIFAKLGSNISRVSINKRDIAQISALCVNEPYITFIDFEHPLFSHFDEERRNSLCDLYKSLFSSPGYGIGILKGVKLWEPCAIPRFREPLIFFGEYERQYKFGRLDKADYPLYQYFCTLISQILVRPGKLLLRYLQQLYYLGPIRTIPPRDYSPPNLPDRSRWSNGLGAWDKLLHFYRKNPDGGDFFAQKISDYLSKKEFLDLGYSLRIVGVRQLTEDSTIFADLQLLSQQYEDKDVGFFKRRIWEPLQKLPGSL